MKTLNNFRLTIDVNTGIPTDTLYDILFQFYR